MLKFRLTVPRTRDLTLLQTIIAISSTVLVFLLSVIYYDGIEWSESKIGLHGDINGDILGSVSASYWQSFQDHVFINGLNRSVICNTNVDYRDPDLRVFLRDTFSCPYSFSPTDICLAPSGSVYKVTSDFTRIPTVRRIRSEVITNVVTPSFAFLLSCTYSSDLLNANLSAGSQFSFQSSTSRYQVNDHIPGYLGQDRTVDGMPFNLTDEAITITKSVPRGSIDIIDGLLAKYLEQENIMPSIVRNTAKYDWVQVLTFSTLNTSTYFGIMMGILSLTTPRRDKDDVPLSAI